jgi:D-alanyl-D-alanine carboxypeptidase
MPTARPRIALMALVAAVAATACASASPARAGQAVIVVDADSGAVVTAHDATQLWYPASLTKIMTIYLAFEAIERGEARFADMLTVSPRAAAQPETRLGLATGSRIALKDAILALITRSANDAAVAIAERLAGSEPAFAERMTAKARALGMDRTVFKNASGLPDPDQRTTARDIAMLAIALKTDFPQHYHLFAARQMAFRGRTLPTINGIVVSYPGADGIKTGFTCGSGYNLVASASRDGRRLVAVLLGSLSRADRTSEMTRLLNDGFQRLGRATRADLAVSTLEDYIDVIDSAPPPHRLNGKDCAVMQAAVPGELTPAQLPTGWGLTLGAFNDRPAAKAALDRARARLKPLGPLGRPAIVAQERAGKRSYAAVFAGIGQPVAANACKILRAGNEYCVVITPSVLGNAGAILWRPR